MLPRIDIKGMAMVDPEKETMVNNQDLGVTMMIPPHTATQNHRSYSGPISVSMVPVDSAPRELPENLQPNLLLTLQPVNIRFSTPVPITFPNTDNLPPGHMVDIYSLSERGGFEKVGVGQVSEDGKSIRTVSGGIRATTWHFIAPVTSDSAGNPFTGNFNRRPPDGCESSIICPSSGVLKEEHYFPRFRDSGQSISYRMAYKNPMSMEKMILFQQFRRSEGRGMIMPPPPVMGLAFEYNGSQSAPTWFSTGNILFERQDGEEDFRDFMLSNAVDLSGLSTGFHEADVIRISAGGPATAENPRPTRTSERARFPLEVISPDTEFGRGWRFDEVHRLYGEGGDPDHMDGRIMLVHGMFNHIVFTRNGDGSYSSPDSEYSTLSAIPAPASGFLREMKDGTRYVFDENGFLLGRIDRQRRQRVYHYDMEDRISQIVHHGGKTTNFVYGADGLVESVTDPTGRTTRFEHDSKGYLVKITGPDGKSKLFGYSDRGLMLSQTDKRGRVKTYAYDGQGSVVRAFRPDGTRNTYGTAASRLSGAVTDDLSTPLPGIVESRVRGTPENPTPVLEAIGAEHLIADGKGSVTKFRTNRYGRFVREEDPLGGVRNYDYDGDDNLAEVTDENGNVETRNTWDSMGNILTSFRNGSGTLSFSYEDDPSTNFHQPVGITDSKGNATGFAYDSVGNVTEIVYPNEHHVRMNYKNRYLLKRTEDVRAGTANLFEYDDDGNVAVVRDRAHRILGEFTYDGAGNILTQTDGTGNTRSYTYDNLNRMLTVTDADGGVVTFAYDGMGNLLSLTDQRGKVTSFEYDEMDRVIKRTDPTGKSETYAYDENGNMKGRTDRNGDTINYGHDALNRIISEMYPDGTGLSFEYDPAGNITRAATPDAVNTFAYDDENRVRRAGSGGILPEVELFYGYDKNGNLKILDDTEIHSEAVRYEYDVNDNLMRIMAETPRRFTSEIKIYYDRSQRRSGVFYPNGVTGVYTYEATKQFRLRELVYKSDDTVHSSFKYGYDLNDFVTQVDTVRSGITVNAVQNYVYDKRNQLTSATKPMGTGTETFTYDGTGNRLQRDGETTDSTFDDVNRLLSDKKFTYEYDNNGNMTKKTGTGTGEVAEFTWDYRDRLVGVVIKPGENANPTSTISYKYDAFNRRIEKDVNGTITRYVYDRGNIHLEYDGENTFQAKYVHSDSVDEPLRMERPDNPYRNEKFPVQEFYYHRDRLGNITEITDFEGTVVQRYVYDAFGKVSIFDKDGNAITPNSANYLKSPYAFTGQEYDYETGNIFFDARYLDPNTGRYISEDSIGFAGLDENLYRYVGNNSVNFRDPSGNLPIIALPILGAGVGWSVGYFGTLFTGGNSEDATIAGIVGAVGGAAASLAPIGVALTGIATSKTAILSFVTGLTGSVLTGGSLLSEGQHPIDFSRANLDMMDEKNGSNTEKGKGRGANKKTSCSK